MKSTRWLAILTAATLTTTLTGCGEDDQPTVAGPPPAEQTSATTEAPADPAPTTEAPSTEAPAEPSDDAPTSQAPEPTDEAPAGDLPTEPTAYGDMFVQAWVDQDEALLEQLGNPDVVANMDVWGGQGWARGEVRQETHGAVVINYADDQNMQLELWVQEGITQGGEPHGVVSATVAEGAYPIPETVEDYATAFVDAAGGDAEDRAYLERLGTPEAAAEAQDWFRDFVWTNPQVSDGPDANTVEVTFTGDRDDVKLVLLIDHELAESAAEDAVLKARMDGGLPDMSIKTYADTFVLAFGEGDAEKMGDYATDEVVDELRDSGGPGWQHVHSGANGGEPVEVYEDTESGRELILTLDAEMVDARDYQAIVGAELSAG